MLSGTRRVLVARPDHLGDVILSGPAVRAIAASGAEVHYLCSPQGRPAAEALPGVTAVIEALIPWILSPPPPVSPSATAELVGQLAAVSAEEAVVFTSFHQSPLPLALLLRLAGTRRIAAISPDYPGSLLDVRHAVDDDLHEVERALSLARAAGFDLPPGDDGRLRLEVAAGPPVGLPPSWAGEPYLVVHPGASVPARAWSRERNAELVSALTAAGHRVAVTGGPEEAAVAGLVSAAGRPPGQALDLAGRTNFAALVGLIAGARALICGNTGPAHVAAAVGTPTVSLYAPTVPASRWRPWSVPHVLLGRQDIECAGCRARDCPVPGHPCLSSVPVTAVLDAVEHLISGAPSLEAVAS